MKKMKQEIKRGKMPLSIIVIMIWMVIVVLMMFFKQFNMEKLALNKNIMGGTLALFDYILDFIILFLFIVFIVLFWKKKNVWKSFIYFIIFLMIGQVFSVFFNIIYLDEIVKASQSLGILTSSSLIFISLLIALIHLGFYSLIIYFVYKNKDYFNKT